jgi:hypothetical protein
VQITIRTQGAGGLGVFSSLLLAIGSLAVILFPWFADSASMAFMIPMFFYEVPLGLWFLIKGVKVPMVQLAASSM